MLPENDKAITEPAAPRETADARLAKLGLFPISPIRVARGGKSLYGYGTREQADRYERGEVMLTMPTKAHPEGELVEIPLEKRVPHPTPKRTITAPAAPTAPGV